MANGLFDDLIPQAPTPNVTGAFDDLIPATTGQGLLGAAQRGVQSAQQVFPVFQLIGSQDRGPSMRQERAAFEQAMSDPRYMASLTESFDEPLRAAKIEETLGPERRLGDIRQRQEAIKQIWSGVVTDFEKEKAATPRTAAQLALGQAQTPGQKWEVWKKNPVQLTATIVAESLPASIAGAVLGTATAGPGIGTAAGVGLSSFATTLSSELLNEAYRLGYDISDQQALARFVSSDDFDRAFNLATTKAAPVAGIDSATAGAAGRFIEPAIRQGLGAVARATGKEVTQQALGGGAGEYLGQTLAGQPRDWFDIAMESVAEIFTAPGEAVGNIRRTRRIGVEPQDRPVIQRIERPPDDTQTQRQVVPPVQEEAAPQPGVLQQPQAGTQAITPGGVLQEPLEPVFPLRPGTRGTPWEDQRGRPIRQNPDTGRWEVIPPPTPGEPSAPTQTQIAQVEQPAPVQAVQTPGPVTPQAQLLTKVAPVTFLQVQEGMPELVWYRLNADITSPDGRVYPAGKNISNGELARFGYAVPESEARKALPVQLPTIGRFEIPGTPAEQYETVLQTIRSANANTKAKIQALFPRAELSREQAQSLRNLAFPETKEAAQTSFALDAGRDIAPISRFEIDEAVSNFRRQYPGAPTINIVNTEAELPASAIAAKPSPTFRVRAVTQRNDDGTAVIWLVADRMDSPQKVQTDLAHEVIAHYGLNALMGDEMRAMNRAVFTRFQNSPEHQDILGRYGFDPNVSGEEIIARIAQNPDQDLNLWQQIVAAIQRWWRENINPNRAISDLEIRRALMRSRRFLQQQPAVEYREFSPEGDLITAYAGETPEQPAPEESPFDRMRRESGAEPPLELTPEQQRAREINERIRGRRPETLSAASPKTQEEMDRELAVKEAEEENWVKHRALGVDDWVLNRDQWKPEEIARSRRQAEETFSNAGIPYTWNEENQYYDIQPGATVESQYRLLGLVKEALRRQNWPAEPEVAALINSITANAKLGRTDYFDSYVRRQLYKLTRSEASHRGALLGALSHFAKDIREVSLRVEEILERTWADAYSGPAVEKAAEDLAKLVAQMAKAKEVADRILAKAPELTQAGVDAGLIGQIFQMPFFTQAELKERFISAVIKKTNVTPAEATKLWNIFKEKFDPIRRELGRLALQEVKSLLRPDQRHLIKKPIWLKIQQMVDAGEFDAGHILGIIAGEHGWRRPTQEEIAKLKKLAQQERGLRELNDKERAEVEKYSDVHPATPEAFEKARAEKEKKTEQHRNAILKEMDTRWARFTRPISLNPLKWFGLRHNTAAAGLELIAANLLATIGFPFRLSISIASQILPHMTLTPIAYSWQQHQGKLNTLEGQKAFVRDAFLGMSDSIEGYLRSVKPAAYAARAAFLGRGEQRNVLRLTSSIAAFDRIRLKAQEEFEKGNVAKGWAMKVLGMLDIGFRSARALDAFQTLPAETAEMYHQIRLEMGKQGKSLTEIKAAQDTIMDKVFGEWMQAIADTKKGLADAGIENVSEARVKEIAGTLIRHRQYQKANELGLPGDDWQRINRLTKSTLAWNEAETKGAGGVVGGALKRIQRGIAKTGIPTDIGVFSNAIATAINRQLHFTPFYHILGGGVGEGSPWFRTEIDRKRRALDALAGTGFGSIVVALVLMGVIKVQLPRRMDDDEKEKFIAEGHRFGTVEFKYGDTFVPVSINNSPLWIVAPYLAGAGALVDLQERRQKEQDKLNAEAAKKGLPPGEIRPMDPGDLAGVAAQAAWQTIFGSRTFSGFLGSIANYGEQLNTRRIVAGRLAPWVPGLPLTREVVSRMGGVTLNNKMATVWDYMLPLPSSQAAMVNKLGDPVRTPSDIQRVIQVLSGGSYGPVTEKQTQAYQTLYGSEFHPPSISPNKGYQFPDSFRPMNNKELSTYSKLRGQYFQQGLTGVLPGDEAAVKSVYQQAERRALTEVGVQVPTTTRTSARGTTTTRRGAVIRGPRRLRTRASSRLRRPRIRRLSYRRPRLAVRRPRLRRIRRLAA